MCWVRVLGRVQLFARLGFGSGESLGSGGARLKRIGERRRGLKRRWPAVEKRGRWLRVEKRVAAASGFGGGWRSRVEYGEESSDRLGEGWPDRV